MMERIFPSRSTTEKYVVSLAESAPGATVQLAFAGSIRLARLAAYSFESNCFTGMFPNRGSPSYAFTSAYASFMASILVCNSAALCGPPGAGWNCSMIFSISSAGHAIAVRRKFIHRPIAIAGRDGFHPLRGILRQVGGGHPAAELLRGFKNRLRYFSLVERRLALVRNSSQRLGKVGVAKDLARLWRLAAGQIDVLALRIFHQIWLRFFPEVMNKLRHRITMIRIENSRLK